MKNVLALSAALTLGLAACGGAAVDAAEEETPPSAAAAGTMSVTILEPTDRGAPVSERRGRESEDWERLRQ